MNLEKAKLSCQDGGGDIEFMFNPNQLAFEGIVETAENSGARSQETGKPKVSFSHVKAYKVTINNILFDTYEDRLDVVKTYIDKFKAAVEFVKGKERPPIYTFQWGKQVYLRRCFIEKLNYKLTLFLPDGTPVRAVIDSLTLKEADEPKDKPNLQASQPSTNRRRTDTPRSRSRARR